MKTVRVLLFQGSKNGVGNAFEPERCQAGINHGTVLVLAGTAQRNTVETALVQQHMNTAEIGNLIRFHRKAAGLTQKELADLAGVGKTVVFDLEKGKKSVQLDTMMAMFTVLNMKMKVEGPLVSKYYGQKQGGE